MKIHKMKLADAPFKKIASKKKTIESRLYDKKRQKINLGDQIEFTCKENAQKKVIVIIKALYHYPDFESLFSDFPPSLFGETTKKKLLKEIEIYYSKEEQNKYGVLGIKIERTK